MAAGEERKLGNNTKDVKTEEWERKVITSRWRLKSKEVIENDREEVRK